MNQAGDPVFLYLNDIEAGLKQPGAGVRVGGIGCNPVAPVLLGLNIFLRGRPRRRLKSFGVVSGKLVEYMVERKVGRRTDIFGGIGAKAGANEYRTVKARESTNFRIT